MTEPSQRPTRFRNALELLTTVAMLAAAVVVVWALVFQPRGAAAPSRAGTPLPTEPIGIGNAAAIGSESARLVLMVFSDFQCPYCRRLSLDSLAPLRESHVAEGRLRIVFRHLPLTRVHSLAERAAAVGECARQQGQFWKFHDAIFEGPEGGSDPELLAIFESFESVGPIGECYRADRWRPQVDEDQALAASLGIRTTPTAILGVTSNAGSFTATKVINGALPVAEFTSAIDEALAGL
jgi:protein-disulfide isomerase